MTKKICISGYYGFDNFGDETILKILIENIKKYIPESEITVFSSNPNKTSTLLNIKSTYSYNAIKLLKTILSSDCLISGGGSLLQDATSIKSLIYYLLIIITAQFFRKKTIIFAQGIGPINNKLLSKITSIVLKNASLVTVRDENSFNLLSKWNIKAIKCNDPVWNLNIKQNSQENKIGIQLRSWNCLNDNFLKQLAVCINNNYSEKEIIIFSLQNQFDITVCNKFKNYLIDINPQINVKVIENTSNEKVIEDISQTSELIAMRYHACLTAIKANIKLLPINYDIKVENLAKDFNIDYLNLNNIENMEKVINNFKTKKFSYNNEKISQLMFDFNIIKTVL